MSLVIITAFLGARTIIMMRLADAYYNVTGLTQRILGAPLNNQQIYVEQKLEALLAEGALDVGFFYDCEQQWNVTSRFISLPSDIDMSDASKNSLYATVTLLFESIITIFTAQLLLFRSRHLIRTVSRAKLSTVPQLSLR